MSKHRGYYTVADFRPFLNNPAKFHNPDGKNLVARSGLEMRWFKKLDQLPNVLKWSSERVVIPYEKPKFATESDSYIIATDQHKYIVDCWVLWQNGDQTVEMLVEIKPETMCYPPREPKIANKKSLKNYHEAMQTYLINRAKWVATVRFCRSLQESKSRNVNFVIFTETKIESANKILGI